MSKKILFFIVSSPFIVLALLLSYVWISTSGKELWCKRFLSEHKEWMLIGNGDKYSCENKNVRHIKVHNQNDYPIEVHYYYDYPSNGDAKYEYYMTKRIMRQNIEIPKNSTLVFKMMTNDLLHIVFFSVTEHEEMNTEWFEFVHEYSFYGEDISEPERNVVCFSKSREEYPICKEAKEICQIRLDISGENVEKNELLWEIKTFACNYKR